MGKKLEFTPFQNGGWSDSIAGVDGSCKLATAEAELSICKP